MVLSHRYRACLVFLRRAYSHTAEDGNYYKILGISPSASQAEVKAAYFELSKKHHPDRNQGSEESARIFRLVKTAYEVLGSQNRRLQYDKERIFQEVRRPVRNHQTNNPDYKDDAERMHFQSRARTPFRKYSGGKTTYYDFDAWFEGHYGKDSAEIYEFKEPRQFKYHKKHTVKEKSTEVFPKVQSALFLAFYAIIILSGLRFSSNKKTGLKSVQGVDHPFKYTQYRVTIGIELQDLSLLAKDHELFKQELYNYKLICLAHTWIFLSSAPVLVPS